MGGRCREEWEARSWSQAVSEPVSAGRGGEKPGACAGAGATQQQVRPTARTQ